MHLQMKFDGLHMRKGLPWVCIYMGFKGVLGSLMAFWLKSISLGGMSHIVHNLMNEKIFMQ